VHPESEAAYISATTLQSIMETIKTVKVGFSKNVSFSHRFLNGNF